MGSRLLLAGLAMLLITAHTQAAAINYTQTFQTLGLQASATGPFANATAYPGWSYLTNGSSTTARVFAAGALTLGSTSGSNRWPAALISASYLAGQSTFDVSTNALTVSVDITASSILTASSYNVGVVIGNAALTFQPTANATFSIQELGSSTAFTNQTMSFTPTAAAANLTVSVLQAINGTYDLAYTLTQGANVFTNSFNLTAVQIGGPISSVGFRLRNRTQAQFSNFTVTQADSAVVPAPATLPAGLMLLGMLAMNRRRAF